MQTASGGLGLNLSCSVHPIPVLGRGDAHVHLGEPHPTLALNQRTTAGIAPVAAAVVTTLSLPADMLPTRDVRTTLVPAGPLVLVLAHTVAAAGAAAWYVVPTAVMPGAVASPRDLMPTSPVVHHRQVP